jgi:hypothetical protein
MSNSLGLGAIASIELRLGCQMTFAQKPGSFQLLLKAVSDCEQPQVPLVLSGAQYMDIAAELEIHTKQELEHALTLSRRSTIWAKCRPSHPSQCAPEDMLRFDLDNENETIRNYRDRVRQCEALGEYAMAEQIRQILMQEQDHQNRSGDRARH